MQLQFLQELARYWAEDYDFGRLEARLNALPQYTTNIDGLDIHFIHVKSEHEDALPLIITHGWPGSVIEMLDVIGPLTDPTAHGGSIDDAFDVVIPSIPGYGFSSQPTEVGWDSARIGAAWAELMSRLGYSRYVAQGGDQGAGVTDAMGRQAPDGLLGVHFNFLDAIPKELLTAAFNAADRLLPRGARPARQGRRESSCAATSPRWASTRRRSATRSSIRRSGSPAWMLDHDADSYEKISKAFLEGEQTGNLSRDNVLDNITLYWVTGTGASTSRLYWETGRAATASFKNPPPHMRLPAAYTVFPDELFQAPRHWVKHAYHNLVYYNEAPKGGHFAAWEEPEIFAGEMRAAFKSLRDEGSSS